MLHLALGVDLQECRWTTNKQYRVFLLSAHGSKKAKVDNRKLRSLQNCRFYLFLFVSEYLLKSSEIKHFG